MNQYIVTFLGFNGKRNLTVRVYARNEREAEYTAKADNPGWLTIEPVEQVESTIGAELATLKAC